MLTFESVHNRFKQWTHESWVASGIKIGSVLLVVVNAFFGMVERRSEVITLFGLDKCYQFDPASGKADKSKPKRDCLPGKISFIKWTDPNQEGDPDLPQVEVVDRPNRVLQILRVSGNRVVWGQQKLLRVTNGKEEWQLEPMDYWLTVQGGDSIPAWMLFKDPQQRGEGFVLRHFPPSDICTKVSLAKLPTTNVLLTEFFVQNDAAEALPDKGNDSWVYWRTVPFNCDQDVGDAFRFGDDFGLQRFKLAQAIAD